MAFPFTVEALNLCLDSRLLLLLLAELGRVTKLLAVGALLEESINELAAISKAGIVLLVVRRAKRPAHGGRGATFEKRYVTVNVLSRFPWRSMFVRVAMICSFSTPMR